MKTGHDYFREYQKKMELDSDEQIIARFNREVKSQGSGTARFSYLSALHHEFIRRGFDFSVVGDAKSLSFKNLVSLENKIIRLL